ncbi:MAG TPA: Yip1 family protein [Candidatus Kapabacteria bacterium]|nr:Yip1 family protein [Candidatus Kapabacteria bacterium]
MALISRAKNMIMTPKTEWPVVATEEPNAMKVFTGYIVPWIIIDAVCAFVGHGIFWGSHYGGAAMSWGLYYAVMLLVTQGISVWVTAAVVNALAPSFGSEKNMGRAMQTVGYGSTASYVGGILAIIPFLGWLGMLFGLYGIYLFYLGLPHTMKTPQDKVVVYMIVIVVVLIVIWIILGAILASALMSMFGLGMLAGTKMMGM